MADSMPSMMLPPEVLKLTQQLEREKFDSLTRRYDVQRKENELLKTRLEKSEKDTHEFVAYFQKELEGKDVRLHSLSELLAQQDAERSAERELLTQRQSEHLAAVEAQQGSFEREKNDKILQLEDELAKVETFREMKREMDTKIEQLERELSEAREAQLLEATGNERKFLAEKSKMQKDLEKRTAEIRRLAKQEMQNGLDADTLKVIGDNRRMAEELRFQQQMTSELHGEKKRLDAELKVLRRDKELSASSEAEYARQAHARTNSVRKLEEKCGALEELLREAARKFQSEKLALKKGLQASLEDQTLDAAGLRQMLRLKNRELKQLRHLAECVLEQRTEVEQFFLQALDDVKQVIREKNQQRYREDMADYRNKMRDATLPGAKGAQGGEATFPKIRALQAGRPMDTAKDLAQHIPHAVSNKVQLRELSPEDREHVLRLLFAKINAVQANVRAMPPHDLDRAHADMTFLTSAPLPSPPP